MISRWESVIGFALFDVLGSIVRFPVWWYGNGLFALAEWSKDGLVYRWQSYALSLWIRQFFVPMYGAYDWTGRLISIVMRLVVIVWRMLIILLEAGGYVLLIFLWVLAPIACIGMAVYNILQGMAVASMRSAL